MTFYWVDKKIRVFELYLPKTTKIWIYELLKDFLNNLCLLFYMPLSLILLWRNFSEVLFACLIKEDVRNVLLLFARKPWGTGMIFWSRAAVSTLGRSHLVLIDPGVKIIDAYHRDALMAQHLLPVISSNVCWMCGRTEVRITEDQMWTTKRRTRNEHHKRLAEIRNRTQQSLQTFVSFYLLNKMLRNVGIILLV